MSFTQRTTRGSRRKPQAPPTLRIEVRPLLVEGRHRKRRPPAISAPIMGGRQRRRHRPTHLISWLAAFGLVGLALITVGIAYALSGHPGGIRHTSDLASISSPPTNQVARPALIATHAPKVRRAQATTHSAVVKAPVAHRHATKRVSASSSRRSLASTHAFVPTHTTSGHHAAAKTTHTAATHATKSTHSSATHATKFTHSAATHATKSTNTVTGHAKKSADTATKSGSLATGAGAQSEPKVPVTSTPNTTSATSVQTDVAPSSTDMSTSEMALAAAASTSSFAPPAYLIADYKALAQRYNLSWQVLAALSYTQDGSYSEALAGEQATQLTTAARAATAAAGHGANVNVVAQASAGAASPNAALLSDASKLAAAGAAVSPETALSTMTGSAETAQEVLTVAQGIGSLAPQTDTELAADAGPQATAASSSSKAYADVPTAAVTSTTTPTGQAATEVAAMLTEANLLNEMPYVWGGGHDATAWLVDSGYDCSGFVSEVLHSAGYLSGPDTTQTLPDSAGILSGPGKYVTIYDRTVNTMNFATEKKKVAPTASELALKQETAGVHMTGKSSKHSVSIRVSPAVQRAIDAAEIAKGNAADNTINDEHVVIDIDGQWWESGGDSGDGGAEMVHRIANMSESYLKSFNLVLHPAGL